VIRTARRRRSFYVRTSNLQFRIQKNKVYFDQADRTWEPAIAALIFSEIREFAKRLRFYGSRIGVFSRV
jgi:hypothetical protein